MIAKDGAEGFAFAVLGSPDSNIIIQAPENRADMNDLKTQAERAGQEFYCSTALGGCGGRLMTVSPTKKHPHFRHYSQDGCTLRDTPETRDRFTHRIIQNALVAWLEQLGYPAKAEAYLDSRSRVDVYTTGAVIEVQLSAESSHSMAKRTERYGNVTWLFGQKENLASRDARLEDDGVVLLVRAERDRDGIPQRLERQDIEIGVRSNGLSRPTDAWVPLHDCDFTPEGGVQLGPLRAAQAAISAQREAMQAAKEQAERDAAIRAQEVARKHNRDWTQPRLAPQPPRAIDLPAVELSPTEIERRAALVAAAVARSAGQPGPRPTVFDQAGIDRWEATHEMVSAQLRHVLRYHAIQFLDSYPAWIADVDGRWAEGLPMHLVDPAWAALYRTGVVASGPVASIADPFCDPDGLIIERLVARGLASLIHRAGHDYYESRHTVAGMQSESSHQVVAGEPGPRDFKSSCAARGPADH